MQKLTSHSRSSLFLMEMILSILILALTCTACVRIFAAAKTQRQKARELNHIQELATCAGEVLEGWDGELSSFSQIFQTAANVSDSDGTISFDWNHLAHIPLQICQCHRKCSNPGAIHQDSVDNVRSEHKYEWHPVPEPGAEKSAPGRSFPCLHRRFPDKK